MHRERSVPLVLDHPVGMPNTSLAAPRMSPTLQESDPSSDEEPRPSRWRRWYWPTVTLVAWLAFELTAHPALSIVLLCAHFGTQDILTGFWLWRRDPHRGRGRACAWFSFARGVSVIWIASLFPLALMMWVLILFKGQGPPNGKVAEFVLLSLSGLGLLFAGGAPLAALLGLIATLSAWRHRVKVWLDPGLHRARQADQWPPLPHYSKNSAPEALGMMYVAVGCLLLATAGYLVERFPMLVGWAFFVPAPFVLLLAGVVALADTRCAFDHSECWRDDRLDL